MIPGSLKSPIVRVYVVAFFYLSYHPSVVSHAAKRPAGNVHTNAVNAKKCSIKISLDTPRKLNGQAMKRAKKESILTSMEVVSASVSFVCQVAVVEADGVAVIAECLARLVADLDGEVDHGVPDI